MAHYPGYTVLRTEDCPEQHGTLTLLTHDVSGAAVLLVENEDVNKAFGIGFGTFPSDDTGVFHILEHSVLAGSEKYPVSSPFVQLLKSSMASFLNAMTFPDKTVYPFATPNETDFCNLMEHLQESTNVVKSNQKLLRAIILNIIVVILLVTLGMFLPSKSYYLVMIFCLAIVSSSLLLYQMIKRI